MRIDRYLSDCRTSLSHLVLGVFLSFVVALAAISVSSRLGGPVMLYALLLGMPLAFLGSEPRFAPGIRFSAKRILHVGVALLGVRIATEDVAALGWPTAMLVLSGVAVTLVLGTAIGRAFGLKTDHAVLSSGAVAICGASAALALSTVLPRNDAADRNLILTVIGVTTLSTIAMVLYPFVLESFGVTDQQAGVFIGATIHDVAQVVGAGYIVSTDAGDMATIVKLMRVGCLVPVVLIVGLVFRKELRSNPLIDASALPPLLPRFLVAFLVLAALNSFGLLPIPVQQVLADVSRFLLVVSVAALGMKTSLADLARVGGGPVAAMVAQTLLLAAFAALGLALMVAL